jgi:hypothetical protein
MGIFIEEARKAAAPTIAKAPGGTQGQAKTSKDKQDSIGRR